MPEGQGAATLQSVSARYALAAAFVMVDEVLHGRSQEIKQALAAARVHLLGDADLPRVLLHLSKA